MNISGLNLNALRGTDLAALLQLLNPGQTEHSSPAVATAHTLATQAVDSMFNPQKEGAALTAMSALPPGSKLDDAEKKVLTDTLSKLPQDSIRAHTLREVLANGISSDPASATIQKDMLFDMGKELSTNGKLTPQAEGKPAVSTSQAISNAEKDAKAAVHKKFDHKAEGTALTSMSALPPGTGMSDNEKKVLKDVISQLPPNSVEANTLREIFEKGLSSDPASAQTQKDLMYRVGGDLSDDGKLTQTR